MHCLRHHRHLQQQQQPHHHHHYHDRPVDPHHSHDASTPTSAQPQVHPPPRARPRTGTVMAGAPDCGSADQYDGQPHDRRPMHNHRLYSSRRPMSSSPLPSFSSSSSPCFSSPSCHQTTPSHQQQQQQQQQQRQTPYSHPVLSLVRMPSSSSSPSSVSVRHPLIAMSSSPLSLLLSTIPLLLLLLLLLILAPSRVAAHSFLTYPEPYTRCDNHGRHMCPPPLSSFDKANPVCVKGNSTARNPSAVFQRGDKVVVKWARNNHNGGFIRLGFVPVAKMFDAHMHARMAFYYGCWEQGLHRCKGVQCGSDLSGVAFRRAIYIPAALPDGKYVLSFLWFGGTDQPRDSSQFGDYSSCAFIHISGGRRYRPRPITPFFVPGTPREMARQGKNARTMCLSYTNRPGACKRGCGHLKARYMKPYPFDEVAKTKWQLRKGDGPGVLRGLPKWEKVTLYKRPKAIPPRLYENKEVREAICSHKFGVCCPTKCRVCEGYNCGKRRGGPRNCCPDRIKLLAPKCGNNLRAPCRLR